MKKILNVFMLFFAFFSLAAQNKSLHVVYVTKDYTTEVNPLCRDLRDLYSLAEVDNSQAVVFYLANSTSPMIVKMNLPGDNRKDFDGIIDALMTKSETIVNPSTDLNGIVNIFNETGIIDLSGQPTFLNVELTYYITPSFWELRYNEQIIAASYFALELDQPWARDYFSMNIYHNAKDGLVIDEERPFGDKNYCYNYKFFLLTYSE